MDAVEAYQQSWVRAGNTVGVTIDPATLPDMRYVRQTITEFNDWMQRASADTTTWTVLSNLDLFAPRRFAYELHQAGLFSAWPSLVEHWPEHLPLITTWHNMVNVAVSIYRSEIRPHASSADIELFQELDHIMAAS